MTREWTVRLVILGMLAIILGVPFLLRPSQEAAATPVHNDADGNTSVGDNNPGGGGDNRLVILSPHNEQIRSEFALGFNRFRVQKGEPPVQFDWRSSGGTSDLRKQIIAEYQAALDHHTDPPGYDLMFGGGDFEHNILARGIAVHEGSVEKRVPITAEIKLPPGMLKEVFPEATIGGVPLYHPKMLWVGVVLSSFGIIYNRDVLTILNLPEPKTWSDLADGRYRNNVALADPAHSGSIAVTYNNILRREGWTEGWADLRRIFANARYFTTGATKVPVDVTSGEAAAGMCIDFYGRFQAGAVGGQNIGYVDPPRLTAVTPDPVSILSGAAHPKLALEFVVWLLSPQGQRLWQYQPGTPGGPLKYALRRLPIRRDLYTPTEMSHWSDQVNPFEIASPLPKGMPDFYALVPAVSHAMAIDIHDDLHRAWTAIIAQPQGAQRESMVELFDAMPPELTLHWPDADLAAHWSQTLGDPANPRHGEVVEILKKFADGLSERYKGGKDADKLLADRLQWTQFFRDNYRRIVELAQK